MWAAPAIRSPVAHGAEVPYTDAFAACRALPDGSKWSAQPLSSVLQLFVDLVRLRARPQDLPASDGLVLVSALALAVTTTLALQPFYPLTTGSARVGLDLLLQLLIVQGTLRAIGHPERFRQTFTAICGTGVIFTLLAWPLYTILVDRDPSHPIAGASVLLVFGIYGWAVAVLGHILRHALEIRMSAALGCALLYVVVTTAVGEMLLPPPEEIN